MICQRTKGQNFISSSACRSRGWKPNSKCHKLHWEAARIAKPQWEPRFGIRCAEERGEMGLKKVWIPWGIRGSLVGGGEKVGAFRRVQMIKWVSLVSHREEFSASYSLKNKKKWGELCLLLPDTITASRIWKQTHAVARHTIKALHIHRRGKKMYPKNSLLVTENPCASAWVTVKVSLMTVHLLRISQPAASQASRPSSTQSIPSPP